MDKITEFARDNGLARKFEKAIERMDTSKGWAPFAGLEEGEVQVKVTYDGTVRFHPVKKAKKKKKTPTEAKKSDPETISKRPEIPEPKKEPETKPEIGPVDTRDVITEDPDKPSDEE